MWGFVIFVLGILVVGFFYVKSELRLNKFPPGPPRLPIVGSLPYFFAAGASIPAHAYNRLAKKYGPIFGLKLGSVPAIILNSYDAIQSVAFHDDFQTHIDEDEKWLLAKSKGKPSGLFFTSPTQWKEQLNLGHKLLRKYGFKSNNITEQFFIPQMTTFCQDLKDSLHINGQIYRVNQQFHAVFFNTTWLLITGQKLDNNDPFLAKMVHATDQFIKSCQLGSGFHTIYPQLVDWFPKWTGFTDVQKLCNDWYDTVHEIVMSYRKEGIYKINPRNMIEEYLQLIDERGSPNGDPSNLLYTDIHVVGFIQDLLLGGIDTQSHMMKFWLQHVIQYPEIQKKIREEVDRVVGSRLLTTDDYNRLIYTQAVFMEIYRMVPIVEISLRKIWRNSKLDNYELPKGTFVFANIYAANREEALWKNSDVFDPQRFICSSTGEICNAEKVLTFGYGKRPCVGEAVAKRNLVIAAALLIQQFTFEEDPTAPIPTEHDVCHSISQDLPPFTITVKLRN